MKLLGLKAAIVGTGKTQRVFSLETLIPETRLSQIICGLVEPTERERATIARALNLPADALFALDAQVEIRCAG